MDADEKVVVITGATGNLGSVVTQRFAEAGHTLALAYHSQEKMDALSGKIPGVEPLTMQCDVTDEQQVEAFIKQVHEELGGPDVLLNIAGGWAGGKSVAQTPLDTWEHMMDLNLKSAFLCCKYVLTYMLQQDWGRIVNVSSKLAGDLPEKTGAYAVSKAGVDALTGCIGEEVKGTGVSVVSVRPGIIDTSFNRKYMKNADYSKWIAPAKIADVMVLLATDIGGEMNGAIIPLYGDL
ncbi:MAG: SDR family NAD(P)-dependent oxidoreductase [Armatimonadota bacterium]